MAKFSVDYEESDHPAEVRVTRAQLISFIEVGIEKAYSRSYGFSREQIDDILQPESLRDVGRTTDRIDAQTWKCRNSCGCPMYKAGRITLGAEGRELPEIISSFVEGYDSATKEVTSGQSSSADGYTLIVSD